MTTTTNTLAELTAAREEAAERKHELDGLADAARERLLVARDLDADRFIEGLRRELTDAIAARDAATSAYRRARVAELDAKADAEVATAAPMVSLAAAESVVARLAEVEAERDAARAERDEANRTIAAALARAEAAERRTADAETQLNTALSILGNRANAATKAHRYAAEADVEDEQRHEARGRRDALTAAYTAIRAELRLDEADEHARELASCVDDSTAPTR